MTSLEIRKKFFDFFIERKHEKVASSSLIPAQDPTLLFANAGMNQFKDVFLGLEQRSYTRAVSIQKCVRAGGKHNDLDNVGFTQRHLTFFEMMGNFSFGDYFKKEAIRYAWDFLTKEMHLPVERLYASVYQEDEESYVIWHEVIGLPQERIHRLGASDNFWQMGDTGPCGPCTEIYIDRGDTHGCKTAQCAPGCSCDRFLEIWNNVFMQFDRQPDGTDRALKRTGVDTGMGLERLCTVMQGVESVYETDLFVPIIEHIERLVALPYAQQSALTKAAFRVLADHIRSSTMLIADGCAPSNEGRGYVLRKIIRRAALFAQKLTDKNIFPLLSSTVVEQLGDMYPELRINAQAIIKILESEIEKFSTNLVRGKALLGAYCSEHTQTKVIDGKQAFKLYDTYGFPIELVVLAAAEHGFSVDTKTFEQEMQVQKNLSGKKSTDELAHTELPDTIETEFTGYDELETASEIIALVANGVSVEHVLPGTTCYIITKRSPFFIVGGGQVPDQGWVLIDDNRVMVDQARYINKGIALQITTPCSLSVGMKVIAVVDKVKRQNCMKNHTATHMLQAALMSLFGKQIKQSGSLVHPDYLRFDFTYHEQLSVQDIKRIEDIVNAKIMENIQVCVTYTTMKEATSAGVIAFFGDKYNPERVRVVDIPFFSAELCGGTHVPATGVIGAFKITDVSSLSAGHKRIVAVTGPAAVALFQDSYQVVKTLSQDFKVKREEVLEACHKQEQELERKEQQIKQLQKKMVALQLPAWLGQVKIVNGIETLFLQLQEYSVEQVRDIMAVLQAKKPGFYGIATLVGGKNNFMFGVSPLLSERIDLKKLSGVLEKEHAIRSGGTKIHLQGSLPQPDITVLAETLEGWLKEI